MNLLDPFNRGSKAKVPFVPSTDSRSTDRSQPADERSKGFVVRRNEDGKFLSFEGKPTSDLSEAEPHDSHAMASIWAEKAAKQMPGHWESVPHPGAEDPDGDDDAASLAAAYGLPKRAA